MGISANQARQILLDSRKMDLEYQMQNVSNERLMLAKKSSSMLADMLNLVVPTPPSTTDFMETVYSFTSDGENFNLLNWEQSNGEDGYGYNVTISRPVSETVYTASTGKSTPTLSRSVAASFKGSTDITEALKTYTYPVVSGAVANKTTDAVASFLPDKMTSNPIANSIGNITVNNTTTSIYNSIKDSSFDNIKYDENNKMSFSVGNYEFTEVSDSEYLKFANSLDGVNKRLFSTKNGSDTEYFYLDTTKMNSSNIFSNAVGTMSNQTFTQGVSKTFSTTTLSLNSSIPDGLESKNRNTSSVSLNGNNLVNFTSKNGNNFSYIKVGALNEATNAVADSDIDYDKIIRESNISIEHAVVLKDTDNSRLYVLDSNDTTTLNFLKTGKFDNFKDLNISAFSYDSESYNVGNLTATKLKTVPDNVSKAAGEGNDVYSIKLPSGDVYVTFNDNNSVNLLSNSDPNKYTINGESVEKMNEEALDNTLGQNYDTDKNSYYQNPETGEIWEYNYSSGKWNMYAPEVEYKFNGQEAEKVENWENISGIDQTILNNKGSYDCYIINGQYTFIPKEIFNDAQLQNGSSSSGSTASNVTTYEQKDSMFINTDQLFELSSDQLKELPSNISFDSSTQSIYAVYENNDPSSGTITKYIVMAKGAETGKETNTTTYERKTTYPGGDTTFTAKANIIFEQDGQIPYIDIEGMGTFMLTSSQVQDTEAYDAAMEAYNFDKEEYDRTVSEINTETARLENLDKAFEIQMDQLNTEYKAVSAELDSIEQLLSKNIEKGFKYGQ